MSWPIIARRDWRNTAGQRSTKVLLGLVAYVVLLAGYVYPVLTQEPYSTARFTGYAVGWLTTLVPLVGVLLGYGAVVEEREDGSLLLSLSLPISREDVLVGKYLSRSGLLAATLVISLVVAGGLVVYPYGELDPLPFIGFVVLTVLFGAVWTGMGLAVSLAVSTKRRALVLGVTIFFLLVVVWDTVVDALGLALEAVGLVNGELPEPLQFVVGLAPGRLFGRITDGFLNPAATVDGAWYLSEWVALVLFAGWLVGPLGFAYLRFRGEDLS
ncbi:ABC transporter permease subunit [Halostella sp. PRR32]|uniref:ABC transporter permease n=1 Tax=Halostella sp. PRR32 TaxID=3098147 RepID=UPI002B1D19E0|nr:ABC transporter permease subunit [Halostella sp. PRR32]